MQNQFSGEKESPSVVASLMASLEGFTYYRFSFLQMSFSQKCCQLSV